ncbi:response regulator [Alteromonas oceanisediminis]|uniref:response regulator n=1 Tax=Alteromonas oceanisediminis TaxID=2836180 RepID=UPI001BDB4FD7|nr:response regulator [Alteromonas oceanisediminis]MBT0585479.1 response regulator [Alteromonas oceanisediminis]
MTFPVLICDDSSLARKMAKRSLPPPLQASVVTAENGQQALDIMLREQITLLLLDLTMPVLDGVGVLEQIKARGLEVFVVVVSGDIQPQMQEKVLSLGALDFIKKPVDTQRLGAVLKKFGLY